MYLLFYSSSGNLNLATMKRGKALWGTGSPCLLTKSLFNGPADHLAYWTILRVSRVAEFSHEGIRKGDLNLLHGYVYHLAAPIS